MPFRNIETHFSQAPQANVKRSSFKYNLPIKMTFNGGDLVPFLVEEVLPGDTFDLKLSKVVRLTTSIHPTMDNLYLDTYFFFVPNRFVWDNWTKFMGENDKAWSQNVTYVPPKFIFGGVAGAQSGSYRFGAVQPQSILNYLLVPSFTNGDKKQFETVMYPFNAYLKVWNDWFRSENLCDEIPIYTGDGYMPGAYYSTFATFHNNTFGNSRHPEDSDSCLKVAKFADYFTRALPNSQKSLNDVLIPAGGEVLLDPNWSTKTNMPWFENNNGTVGDGDLGSINSGGNQNISVTDSGGTVTSPYAFNPNGSLVLNGLEITVNNLRLAMQTQKLLERDARGGRVKALCLHVKKIAEKNWKATAFIVLC